MFVHVDFSSGKVNIEVGYKSRTLKHRRLSSIRIIEDFKESGRVESLSTLPVIVVTFCLRKRSSLSS